MTNARVLRLLAVLGLAALVLLASPGRASAHAFLADSSPAAGQRLGASPRTLTLQFTEAVAPPASDRVAVRSADGRPVRLGPLARSADGTTLTAALPALAHGVYVVRWQDVSADDGHPSAGEFAFAVGSDATLPALSARSSAPTAWPEAIADWVFLLGLALGAGGLASEIVIWGPLARGQTWTVPRAPARVALLAAAGGAAGVFILLAGTLEGGHVLAGLDPRAWRAALQVQAGVCALIALILVLYALVALSVGRARIAAVTAGVAATVAAALHSHPAAAHTWWATAAIVLHVALALLWAGLLAHLVLVCWRGHAHLPGDVLRAAVHRYARLALGTVLLILLTGVGAALVEFHTLAQVIDTLYGRVLLVKTALVALALLLALSSRLRGLRRTPATSLALVRRLTRVEVLTLSAVLGAAALLGSVAPPALVPTARAAADATALLGAPPPVGPALRLAGKAGWLEVYLTASADALALSVRAPDDTDARDVRLSLAATSPTGRDSDLFPRPCGPGCFDMRTAWPRGTTTLRLRVASRPWSGGALTFVVPWPPPPRDPASFARARAAMRARRTLIVHEAVSSGPGPAARSTGSFSGPAFLATEPYGARVADVRRLADNAGSVQLVFYLPGSHIWVHLWLDARQRYQREVVVAPGYLIERAFSYPTG